MSNKHLRRLTESGFYRIARKETLAKINEDVFFSIMRHVKTAETHLIRDALSDRHQDG